MWVLFSYQILLPIADKEIVFTREIIVRTVFFYYVCFMTKRETKKKSWFFLWRQQVFIA